MFTSGFARRLGNELKEFLADELFLRLAEILAVGVIDEGQRGVWQVSADQLGLALHHAAIPLLALTQRLLELFALSDVFDDPSEPVNLSAVVADGEDPVGPPPDFSVWAHNAELLIELSPPRAAQGVQDAFVVIRVDSLKP